MYLHVINHVGLFLGKVPKRLWFIYIINKWLQLVVEFHDPKSSSNMSLIYVLLFCSLRVFVGNARVLKSSGNVNAALVVISSDVCLLYKLRLQRQQLQGFWEKSSSTEALLLEARSQQCKADAGLFEGVVEAAFIDWKCGRHCITQEGFCSRCITGILGINAYSSASWHAYVHPFMFSSTNIQMSQHSWNLKK